MNDKAPGLLRRCWTTLRRPSTTVSLLALLVVGFFAGIIFWGGFNTAMEATNTITFCTGCHEMRDNVYQEYQDTIHDKNRTGVRAICSDCHVPKDWVHKVARKIRATNELYHWLAGTVSTPEKFEAHRMELATHVWKTMKESDSRECRNCHSFSAMKTSKQVPRAQKKHAEAQAQGKTCIDCHKGIAHLLPREYTEDEE
jgi:cytochrome c-type protein NapC